MRLVDGNLLLQRDQETDIQVFQRFVGAILPVQDRDCKYRPNQ
jgi:hypothetical protein